MKKLFLAIAAFASVVGCSAPEQIKSDLRAPAYPLITIDPYTSAWSGADNLYDNNVIHWTEKDFPFIGVLRVDGKPYRFMGIEGDSYTPIAAMGDESPWEATYTLDKPKGDWTKADYNDKKWQKSLAPFGRPGEYDVKTVWGTPNIWLRRNVELTPEQMNADKFILIYSHDDIFELYINGDRVINTGNSWNEYLKLELSKEQIAKWGNRLTIAAHCQNTAGGQMVDFGLYCTNNKDKKLSETAVQTSADVQATRTIYDFTCGGVDLKLTFMAPVLMDNLELMSRPVNYVTYEVTSNDGAEHDVDIYFEAGPHWARNIASQKSESETLSDERFVYAKTGTVEQPVLAKHGDNIRCDWGYFYLTANKTTHTTAAGEPFAMRKEWVENGTISSNDGDNYLAIASNLGKVGAKSVSDYIMVGYDDIYSILYYKEKIRPYWNRNEDSSIQKQFTAAADEYKSLKKRCEKFDAELMAEAYKAGGKEYAELCALAYRQSIAAHKLIEMPNGELAWLSKENFSNGCIGTVDVTYPSFPLFAYYNLDLAKALLNFIFDLCESDRWDKPYAAHDVGCYPHVWGERYTGGMPVEESGNLLVMTGAISKLEGNVDYALKHWDALTQWADYLVEHGGDPAHQLCTDDFMGHSSRNANLAIKAVIGIAAYADMAKMAGKDDVAEKYRAEADKWAAFWKENADEGDHYSLTFDTGAETWSQKYNLVWDKMLGYNVFDPSIAPTEVAYYLTKFNKYGLPLDSRGNGAKCDWVMWTATLADDNATFQKFITPMYNLYNETSGRVPMSDYYHTDRNRHIGMQARSVVGGYWIKMLSDRMTK
ncbi:MAG: DUF4965 domain-containing protein [Alistipes sp.]|nr:DUF4965 domain-containing protein [Alistipes sp.]